MTDIATIWDVANLRGDWVMNGADLQADTGIQTAVLISVFTDRRAASDDAISDGTGDPRGWWGDDDPSYPIGSRLWLLARAKQTNETLQRAKDYLIEALRWLLDDGAAARIDVKVQWMAAGELGAIVTLYRQDGRKVVTQFNYVWNK